MARSNDWEKLAMAQGDPRPAWPLPTVVPKFATSSLGGGRPLEVKHRQERLGVYPGHPGGGLNRHQLGQDTAQDRVVEPLKRRVERREQGAQGGLLGQGVGDPGVQCEGGDGHGERLGDGQGDAHCKKRSRPRDAQLTGISVELAAVDTGRVCGITPSPPFVITRSLLGRGLARELGVQVL